MIFPSKMISEYFEIFVKFQKMAKKLFSKEIKIFQCDKGGEFIKTDFVKYLEYCGIVRHISYPNTPQ